MPYIISDDSVQEVRWIWIDYKDEETGEMFRTLDAAISRYHNKTMERRTVLMSMPEVEVNSMTKKALRKMKESFIFDAIEMLEEEGFTLVKPLRPVNPYAGRQR